PQDAVGAAHHHPLRARTQRHPYLHPLLYLRGGTGSADRGPGTARGRTWAVGARGRTWAVGARGRGYDERRAPRPNCGQEDAMTRDLFSLRGRVALVTGGNGGLGHAIALGL